MGKKVLIYGATGFVGSGLAAMLVEAGWQVFGVSRKGTGDVRGVTKWFKPDAVDFTEIDAVVNLAGEPIDQRWTDEKKRTFSASRVGLTDEIVKAIAALPQEKRPTTLINASAVGIYGDRNDELLDDDSPRGQGYLADLCAAWEEAADRAEAIGLRVVKLRIGIVLGNEGRAFEKLKIVFKAGLGGRLGNGTQWMPWIHLHDLRRSIVFSLENEDIQGSVNGSAPTPERNSDFTRKMAKATRRWVFLPVPGFALKMVLGGFGGALLAGQRAIPAKLTKAGFEFRYPHLEDALKDLTC